MWRRIAPRHCAGRRPVGEVHAPPQVRSALPLRSPLRSGEGPGVRVRDRRDQQFARLSIDAPGAGDLLGQFVTPRAGRTLTPTPLPGGEGLRCVGADRGEGLRCVGADRGEGLRCVGADAARPNRAELPHSRRIAPRHCAGRRPVGEVHAPPQFRSALPLRSPLRSGEGPGVRVRDRRDQQFARLSIDAPGAGDLLGQFVTPCAGRTLTPTPLPGGEGLRCVGADRGEGLRRVGADRGEGLRCVGADRGEGLRCVGADAARPNRAELPHSRRIAPRHCAGRRPVGEVHAPPQFRSALPLRSPLRSGEGPGVRVRDRRDQQFARLSIDAPGAGDLLGQFVTPRAGRTLQFVTPCAGRTLTPTPLPTGEGLRCVRADAAHPHRPCPAATARTC